MVTATPFQVQVNDTVTIDSVRYDTIKNYIHGTICHISECVDYRLGECNVDFSFGGEQDGFIQFTSQASVPYGQITSYQWAFGDGTSSTEQNPIHTFPCDNTFPVTLTIFSPQCENGSQTITHNVTVSGFSCCDRNADSPWQDELYNDRDNKITYRFDLGAQGVEWMNQRLKATIKHYKKRNNGKWKKDKEDIQAIFHGNIFGNDEDGCDCVEPRDVNASPGHAVRKKKKTFRDDIATGWKNKDNWLRINRDNPIEIEYRADGQTLVMQNTAQSNGFVCE